MQTLIRKFEAEIAPSAATHWRNARRISIHCNRACLLAIPMAASGRWKVAILSLQKYWRLPNN
jgi:hypothetical protein